MLFEAIYQHNSLLIRGGEDYSLQQLRGNDHTTTWVLVILPDWRTDLTLVGVGWRLPLFLLGPEGNLERAELSTVPLVTHFLASLTIFNTFKWLLKRERPLCLPLAVSGQALLLAYTCGIWQQQQLYCSLGH